MTIEPDESAVQRPGTDGESAIGELNGSWRDLFSPAHAAAVAVLAGGIAIYAMNIFVTAALLPSAIDDIGGQRYFSWVTTTFMVASVLASMTVARLLARRGAAQSYLIAFLLFGAGALGAALVPSMESMLVMRVLQGLGGGLLAGLGYAVIRDALPQRLWTRATGVVSAMWGVGTLIGPALGGAFAQWGLWRGAFGLLAAVAVVLGVLALRVLPRHAAAEGAGDRFPLLSLTLLVLATAAFSMAAVVSGGTATVAALLIGVALTASFVLTERRASSPVLPHITYQRGNPLKWIYLTLGILSAAAMVEIFLPFFGQRLGGLSPLFAGIFGATVSIGWSTVQIFSASVDSPRVRRRLVLAGPVLMTVGLAVFAAAQRTDAGPWTVCLWATALLIAGAGVGCAFPHLSVSAMQSSDDDSENAKAAAGVGTAELIANTISSALIGVLVAAGGPTVVGSATTMGFGVALLGAVGIATAAFSLKNVRRRASAETHPSP